MQARREVPTIGVTGPDRGGWPAWAMTRLALWRAGGRAVRITPRTQKPQLRLDALVLGGGADVGGPAPSEALPEPAPERSWPARIGGLLLAPPLYLLRRALSPVQHGSDPERDELELRLLRRAAEQQLPVLGICRGAQLMNLSQGGSLLRDVATFYQERPQLYTTLPRRDVLIHEGSRLEGSLRVRRTRVNSLHFHAVDRPGDDIEVVAREPSGVVQAIEHARRPFWVGVQWHPEYLPQLDVQQRLFAALVQQARHPRPQRPAPLMFDCERRKT